MSVSGVDVHSHEGQLLYDSMLGFPILDPFHCKMEEKSTATSACLCPHNLTNKGWNTKVKGGPRRSSYKWKCHCILFLMLFEEKWKIENRSQSEVLIRVKTVNLDARANAFGQNRSVKMRCYCNRFVSLYYFLSSLLRNGGDIHLLC